jgi:hypothetical protein
MTTQEKINLFDIKDYFSMREKKQASLVCWESVKHNNTHLGETLWQLFAKLDDFETGYEPSLTQIQEVKKMLNI